MMEIKFSGKAIENGEVIEGDLIHNAFTINNMIVPFAIKPDRCYPVEVDPKTIGLVVCKSDLDILVKNARITGE